MQCHFLQFLNFLFLFLNFHFAFGKTILKLPIHTLHSHRQFSGRKRSFHEYISRRHRHWVVLLDEEGKLLFGEYRRHCAHTQEALSALLREARERVGDCALRAKITGSGAINLAKALGIPFVQEVVAVADALRREAPQTDVAIELGGEDAKIIYFGTTLEERMNGVHRPDGGAFADRRRRP